MKTLMIDSPELLMAYATRRNWQQDSSGQFFVFARDETKEDLHFVRNSTLISQALGYARELEKIV